MRRLAALVLPAILLGSSVLSAPSLAPAGAPAGLPSANVTARPLPAAERLAPEPIAGARVVARLPPRVILDPGHGGLGDPGTIASNGVTEKDLTLDIARRLQVFLQRAGLRVVLTRTDDLEVPLAERVRLANEVGGDIFVSIHVNWLEGKAHGIETFYVERGYATLRQEESARLAAAVHQELRSHVGEVTPSLVDRGVKEAPFRVLAETRMPAILAEVSTLSNDHEADLLELPAYREYIALALYAGIRSYSDSSVVTPDLGS